jgi:hypothetical protein
MVGTSTTPSPTISRCDSTSAEGRARPEPPPRTADRAADPAALPLDRCAWAEASLFFDHRDPAMVTWLNGRAEA